ncbi:MAG: hypothetical protein R6V10_04260 [bacterium]
MYFKFSCKGFEVAFSGDPAYVEKQIEKYEPHILQALKHVQAEQEKEEQIKTEPEKKPEPASGREENDSRQKHYSGKRRKNHSRGRPPDKKDQRSGGHPYRKEQEESASRSDNLRPIAESEAARPAEKEEDDSIPFPEGGDEKSSSLDSASAPAEKSEPGEGQESASPKDAPAGSSEFPARRKSPRIKGEDLVRTIESKKPRTHHDRVMVFGHYMETEGGGSDFTIPEIKRCYRAVNQDPGNNIEQVINHATRSGFILRHDQARTNRFKLSSKGRRYVEDGLKLT